VGIGDYRTVVRAVNFVSIGGVQMVRQVAAVALVICLSPALVHADSSEFTISSASANVHMSPSTGSPVIGQAPRGRVLKVTRELGSWVRISWPLAADGVGYVHVSMGWFAHIAPPTNQAGALTSPSRSAPESLEPATAAAAADSARVTQALTAADLASTAPAHLVGFGGRMGDSAQGFGVSARAPIAGRFGLQVEASRYAPSSVAGQARLTSIQISPSLLFSLPDKLTDYVWLRPYLGAGVTMYRSKLGVTPSNSVTDSRLGRQVFGGVEAAFAGLPQFALSADYGYRWSQAPFAGYSLGGRGLSVSGHWYVK
jgi:hypothetical protein